MTEQNTEESPVVTIFGEEYKIEDLKPEEHRQIARLQNLKARFENTMNQIAGLQEDAHDLQPLKKAPWSQSLARSTR